MKKILILGAGQSAPFLISFLLKEAQKNEWFVTIADKDFVLAQKRLNNHPKGNAVEFDVNNENLRNELIKSADIVVNLLAPIFQYQIALDCVNHAKNLVTASYTDPRVKNLDAEMKAKNIINLNEMGLDPGIDHMSAMELVEKIKSENGEILSFYSYGSAIPKPSENLNPLGYYITWNPFNVATSGSVGAVFLENGFPKVLSQYEIFRRTWEVDVDNLGSFEAYPNRDSVSYIDVFDVPTVKTMVRATLRYKGYAEVFRQIIQLGMTNSTLLIPNLAEMTYQQFTEMFLPSKSTGIDVRKRTATCLGLNETGEVIKKLTWLGLFSDEIIGGNPKTAADVLVILFSQKLEMPKNQEDMVILMHEIEAKFPNGEKKKYISTMVDYGEIDGFTAIAKTVGMPAAIAVKMILKGELTLKGVQIPTAKEIYIPVLKELQEYGLSFDLVISNQ